MRRPIATSKLHARIDVAFRQLRQYLRSDRRGNQQGFHGVAHGVSLGLGIEGNLDRHRPTRIIVDIHMTDTVEVLDDRNRRFARNPLD